MVAYSISIYVTFTLAIGFWASKRIKTTTDFTLAGKSLSTVLVGVTIFATWFGPELIMGVPGRFVDLGVMGIITDQFGNLLCLLLIGIFYVGKLYRMEIVTLSDYFKIRFNPSLELASSLIYIFTYFFWIASQFVALAYLFQSVLGISITSGIVLGAAIVVAYTYIGGMWAVTYTDLLQSILIVLGLGLLLMNLMGKTDGVIPLLRSQNEGFFDFFPAKGLQNWSDYIAMWMAFGLGALPAQEIYQRAFSAKSRKAAQNGIFLGAFLLFIISVLPLLIALGAVQLHPELVGSGDGQNLIPEMVRRHAGLPLQILLYGAIISAILSTSSGAMLSPATIIGENLLKPHLKVATDKKILLYTRLSVIAVAIISCFVAINDANIHSLVVTSAVLLMVCLFAPLTFGLYWKKASSTGAWAAIMVGAFVWWLCNYFETAIDATIYGTGSSCIAMVFGSLFFPSGKEP